LKPNPDRLRSGAVRISNFGRLPDAKPLAHKCTMLPCARPAADAEFVIKVGPAFGVILVLATQRPDRPPAGPPVPQPPGS
jgi:hypothetical protein